MVCQIVIFTYNRPAHLQALVDSLQSNAEFLNTKVCFALDAPKTNADKHLQKKIIAIIHSVQKLHNDTKVVKQSRNLGSKQHIISTLNREFLEHEQLIILEDDLVLDKFFLSYMLDALRKYERQKDVYHISGFNFLNSYNERSTYFCRYMNCWGWATWRDRWKKLELDIETLHESFSQKDIWRFNCNGSHDFYRQLTENKLNILSTWAIFWYATIFKSNGLCLFPPYSLVKNQGRDNTGERSGSRLPQVYFQNQREFLFSQEIREDTKKYKMLVQYFKSNQHAIIEVIKGFIYLLPPRTQKPIINILIKIRFYFASV